MADPAPRRILIVRISALGDIVFATSLLEGLRNAFPAAHIAWLAQGGFAGILEGDPRVSEIIRTPPGSIGSFGALRALRRDLAAREPFDWVIDAQGLFKSRVVARMAKAATRIGFQSKEPGEFFMDRLVEKGGEAADISSEYRFLAQELTGRDPGAPRLLVPDAAHRRVSAAMAERGLRPGYVALCPFTTRPQKHWFEEYWPELAGRLVAAGRGPCAVLGGPGDRAAADRILASMPSGTVDLVGATKLPDVPAWIAQAGMLIGVDTGLTHIGIATRRPVVALFGSTCPYTRGADSPLHVMYDALPCAPCKRNPTCDGAFTCMRGLTPERVARAALELPPA